MMGYPIDESKVDAVSLATNATVEVAIPLHKLVTMFDSHGDKLCPPFLLSGSRLELQLESAARAFKSAGAATYEISDVNVVLDSYILSDAAFSVMEKMSAAGLVEYTYQEYEVIEQTTASTKINLEMTKSIGRASAAYAHTTVTADENEGKKDLFVGVASADVADYQYRINSLYMPSLPARGIEGYQAVLAHGKEMGRYSYVNWAEHNIITQTLQRSDFLGPSSGLPINSSSSLRLALTFANAAGRTVKLFVPHLKIVTPYLYDRISISV
jgi:hypothetical protein